MTNMLEYDNVLESMAIAEITLEITIVYSFGRSDNTIILKHQLHGLLVPTGLKLSYAQRFRCRLLPNLNFGNLVSWTAQPSSITF